MKGFHLIEILITLAIVSILSLIGFSTYTHYLTHANRLEAIVTLSKLAGAMEHYQVEHNTYQGATLIQLKFPEIIGKNYYQLSIQNANEDDFTLIATPLLAQAENDKQCGSLILKANGEQHVTGSNSANECWS